MTRNMLTFAMLLVLFGSVFAGSTVSVGETIPVGGTTTTTTTTDPDPEPEPEPEPAGGLGGIGMTNDEGDSINIGEDGIEPVEGDEPTPELISEGEDEEGTLGVGLPAGGSSESTEESACGTAFALLAVAAFFARRS
jgi:hypothetical protein